MTRHDRIRYIIAAAIFIAGLAIVYHRWLFLGCCVCIISFAIALIDPYNKTVEEDDIFNL